jgi:hypothetical protein
MTVLYDVTATHTGWRTPGNFADAGWADLGYAIASSGQKPQSYYAQVYFGGPLDLAAQWCDSPGGLCFTYWFNVHTSGPLTGLTLPAGYPPNPNSVLRVYSRTPSDGIAFSVRVLASDQPTTSAPSSTYCQYGTRLQSSVGGNIILTSGIITALASLLPGPWEFLAELFDAFIGATLYTGALCSGPPPTIPTFTADDWIGGQPGVPTTSALPKVWQGLQSVAWPYFCECVPNPPGSPAPTPYPGPSLTGDPGGPAVLAPVVCDNTDLCTTLSAIRADVTRIAGQISALRQDLTLIQRQKVPFAYVAGTLHSGLTHSGQFAVQGILGLSVQLTTVPLGIGETSDDPIVYFRAGWVATGTPDGWRRSVTISHNPMWIDVEPDDTLVGWTFTEGVVANIEEFRREP